MATKPQMAPDALRVNEAHHHRHARSLMWLWYTILFFLALLVFTPKAGGFGNASASLEPVTLQG